MIRSGVVLITLCSLSVGPAISADARDLVYNPDDSNQVYFVPSGFDAPEMLPAGLQEQFRTLASDHPGEGCKRTLPVIRDYLVLPEAADKARRPSSALEAARNSTAILAGRISGVVPGFRGSEAGVLLTVDIDKSVRKSTPLRFNSYRLFLPVGEAVMQGKRYCALPSPDYPVVPAVGDDILIFLIYLEPRADLIDLMYPEQVVLRHGDGSRAIASGQLARELKDSPTSFEDFSSRMMQEAGQ